MAARSFLFEDGRDGSNGGTDSRNTRIRDGYDAESALPCKHAVEPRFSDAQTAGQKNESSIAITACKVTPCAFRASYLNSVVGLAKMEEPVF